VTTPGWRSDRKGLMESKYRREQASMCPRPPSCAIATRQALAPLLSRIILLTDSLSSRPLFHHTGTAQSAGATASTVSQLTPITSAATDSPVYAAPSNSAETEASLSVQAVSGGSAVYASTATGSAVSVDYDSTSAFTGTPAVTSIDYDTTSSVSAEDSAARRAISPVPKAGWAGLMGMSAAVLAGAGVVFFA
jgi:hypothetical protein